MDRIYGGVGRPTVGAAVPCRPHGFNRVENVEWGASLRGSAYLCVR